jgi:hypothetical protein
MTVAVVGAALCAVISLAEGSVCVASAFIYHRNWVKHIIGDYRDTSQGHSNTTQLHYPPSDSAALKKHKHTHTTRGAPRTRSIKSPVDVQTRKTSTKREMLEDPLA